MTPSTAMDDRTQGAAPDAVFGREVGLSFASSNPFTDTTHVGFGEFGHSGFAALGLTSLGDHVRAVVGVRSKSEVLAVAATGHVAIVQDNHSFGDDSHVKFVGETVCKLHPASDFEMAVTTANHRHCGPWPAGIWASRAIHLFPETFSKRLPKSTWLEGNFKSSVAMATPAHVMSVAQSTAGVLSLTSRNRTNTGHRISSRYEGSRPVRSRQERASGF